MKSSHKIDELLNNNYKYLDTIETFIFFNDVWMFPEKESLNNFLDEKLPDSYFNIANIIVKEMNNRNIDPETYDKEIFNKIIKE